LDGILRKLTRERRKAVLESAPPEFFALPDRPGGAVDGAGVQPLPTLTEAIQRTIDDPRNVRAWTNLAILQGREGDHEAVLASTDRALDIEPGIWLAHRLRAAALYWLGRFVEAEGAARRAALLNDKDPRVRSILARVLRALGRSDEAITVAEEEADRAPGDVRAWAELADLYGTLDGMERQAVHAWEHVRRLDPDDLLALTAIATDLLENERWAEAIDVLVDAHRRHPTNEPVVTMLSMALSNAERFEEIERLLAPMMSRRFTDPEAESLARFNLHEARRFLGIASDEQEVLEECIAVAPQFWLPYARRVGVALRANEPSSAIQVMERYLDARERDAEALFDVAWACFAGGHPTLLARGLTWARQAYALAPQNGAVALTLASLLGATDAWSEALDVLRRTFADGAFLEHQVAAMTDFLVEAGAAGRAPEALAALAGTLAAERLRPVVVALRMLAGESVTEPAEVVAVAEDVKRRIAERAAARPTA
ncbi:MAG: tetratricopeptide repeat protein, partial [Polyangiaceae bacterium]